MRGSVGGNTCSVVIPCSHSLNAVKKRQAKVKAEGPAVWVNPHLHGRNSFIKATRAMQAANDRNRENPEQETWHTLKTLRGEVKRCQVMSRQHARKLNEFNRQNRIDLTWVLGKGTR